jgi:hypothetical protein
MVRQRERKSGIRPWREIPPHKSIEDIAREQGIDLEGPIPDYVELFTALLPTKEDVEAFDKELSQIRRKGISSEVDD